MKQRIKELRKQLGFTQAEFAQRLEVVPTAISAWESGRQSIPPSRIVQICQTFHVSRRWLETGDGDIDATSEKKKNDRFDSFVSVALDIIQSLPPDKRDLVLEIAKRLVESSSDR